MAAKRKPTRTTRRKPAAKSVVAGVLDRMGLFKTFTNYGLGGCVVGYMLIFTVPDVQKVFQTALEKQSEQSREDRKSAFEHGEKAVERIATSIDGLRGTFSTVQGKTQDNQLKIVTEQRRTNEILEGRMPAPLPAE